MQELEKFKFVLDYKIKERKKQIEPKEEQITDMKDQVKVSSAQQLTHLLRDSLSPFACCNGKEGGADQ